MAFANTPRQDPLPVQGPTEPGWVPPAVGRPDVTSPSIRPEMARMVRSPPLEMLPRHMAVRGPDSRRGVTLGDRVSASTLVDRAAGPRGRFLRPHLGCPGSSRRIADDSSEPRKAERECAPPMRPPARRPADLRTFRPAASPTLLPSPPTPAPRRTTRDAQRRTTARVLRRGGRLQRTD